MRTATEKLIYKTLNPFPKNEGVRGGGMSAYNTELTANQMRVGMSAYANRSKNGRIPRLFVSFERNEKNPKYKTVRR
jgi:hypothetical protein